jgi:hypothetical protein
VSLEQLHPTIRAWIDQLLDPEVLGLLEAFPESQVDIRLSASKGRVRRRPVLVVNGGPQEFA